MGKIDRSQAHIFKKKVETLGTPAEMASRDRKVRVLSVPLRNIIGVFFAQKADLRQVALPCTTLPDDAMVVASNHDPMRGCIDFLIWSQSFEATLPGKPFEAFALSERMQWKIYDIVETKEEVKTPPTPEIIL